jgi:hypothetical protein
VLLADPRRRPLPAIPAGRIAAPVLGVTGAAAEDVLDEDPDATVEVGEVTAGRPPVAALPSIGGAGAARGGEAGEAGDAGSGGGAGGARGEAGEGGGGAEAESLSATALSPFSSHGPGAGGGVAPGLVAPGAALTAVPGNAAAVVGGSAIAAARAAVEAAQLVRRRPGATPRQLRDALIGAAEPDPRLPARGAGAGVLRPPTQDGGVTARTRPAGRTDPCPDTPACVRVVLVNTGGAAQELGLALQPDPGTEATLARERVTLPAGGRREAEIGITAGDEGLAAGRLVVSAQGGDRLLSHPFAIATGEPQPPPLGPLTLTREGDRTTGVRFPLGAFERGDPLGAGTSIQLTERLSLTLTEADRVVRRLTPPGGARELLPAEYAFTLPRDTLRELGRGRYAFRAVARSPRGGEPATATSDPFTR